MRTVTSRFCCTCIQNMITGIRDMKSMTMHGTKKTSELISTESLFSSDTSHHPSTKLVLCERRPTASPVSRHVLVRPGIFCLWLRAVLQFPPPPPESQRQHRATPTWITVNSEPSSQLGEMQDDSQQGQLHEHQYTVHMQGSLSEGRRCAAGHNNLWYVWMLFSNRENKAWSVISKNQDQDSSKSQYCWLILFKYFLSQLISCFNYKVFVIYDSPKPMMTSSNSLFDHNPNKE